MCQPTLRRTDQPVKINKIPATGQPTGNEGAKPARVGVNEGNTVIVSIGSIIATVGVTVGVESAGMSVPTLVRVIDTMVALLTATGVLLTD